MDSFHDGLRHLRYLRESLTQDGEAVGFFLAAGCPLAVKMPADKWPLIPDVAGLSKAIARDLEEDAGFAQLLGELKAAGKNPQNVEDVLSFVRSLSAVARGGVVRGFKFDQLESLEKKICSAIVKRLNVLLPTDDTPYHQLGKWIRSIERKCPVEVFTTNYDLLLEQALEQQEIPYFDGFIGARNCFFDLRAVENNVAPAHWTRLWKVHGSINWAKSEIEGQHRIRRTPDALEQSSHLIYPSHLKYEESRKMPYLALMDQLSRFIRRKSSLLIMSGYSFGDRHINDTIVNALASNPTAMVLALLFGSYYRQDGGQTVEAYPEAYRLARKQHNLNIWTFDRAIIGTNAGNWSKPNPKNEDEELLGHFLNPAEAGGCEIKLGDFAILGDFLQRFLGSRAEAKRV